MKQTTIIIVTYNSAHIVGKALQNIVGKGYPIFIVDNNSTDNLEEYLCKNYKDSKIELIKLEENVGYSKANNIALRKTKTRYALLLNPDAIIKEDSIENLIDEANKSPKIALAGAFATKKENPSPKEINLAIEEHKKTIKVIGENEKYIETNFLCGGYMLMRVPIFQKIGFLDESLFLYGEDEEICDRVIANNYKIIQVKNSSVYHNEHSATKTNGIIGKYRLLYRRYSHMGWSRIYLKRKRGKKITCLLLSLTVQLLSAFLYLFILRIDKFTIRLGRAIGGLKNLLFFKL